MPNLSPPRSHLKLRRSSAAPARTATTCPLAVAPLAVVLTGLLLGFLSAGCVPAPQSVNPSIEIDLSNPVDFDALLDLHTDSHRDFGCDMDILVDTEGLYAAYYDTIASARTSLHIITLNFDNDSYYPEDLGLFFTELLIAKANEGVPVRLVVDPTAQSLYSRPEIINLFRSSTVEFREYHAPAPVPQDAYFHTHKKLIVADNQRAIIGGSNFGYRYLAPDQWRDTNVLLTGPVVATLQQEFLRDWAEQGSPVPPGQYLGPPPEPVGPYAIRAMDQRPAVDDFDVNNAILIALRGARHKVDIQAPYLNPHGWMMDEILATAARGVQVRIFTNSGNATDAPEVFGVIQSSFAPLVNGGVRVFMWDLAHRTFHPKAITVDDTLGMISSHNLNARSITWDVENAIVVTDPQAVQAVQKTIDDDAAQPWIIEVDQAWLNANPLYADPLYPFLQPFAFLF